MSAINLKEELYKKLEDIDDEVLIQDVLNPIDIESGKKEIIHFSNTQIQLIDEARASVRVSSIPNESVFQKNREWLNK